MVSLDTGVLLTVRSHSGLVGTWLWSQRTRPAVLRDSTPQRNTATRALHSRPPPLAIVPQVPYAQPERNPLPAEPERNLLPVTAKIPL
jgi:hypothetical protein